MTEKVLKGVRIPTDMELEINMLADRKLSNPSQVMREAISIGLQEMKRGYK